MATSQLPEMALNYEDQWWARVYDSIYWATRQHEHDFYLREASSRAGRVLEVACGTGNVLLDLLRLGVDAYGFDISRPMLNMLQRKIPEAQRERILPRVSRQNMVDFSYLSVRFDIVLIPSGSFLFLLTEDQQVACLSNIHRHLRSGGRLMLNFTIPREESLAALEKDSRTFADLGDFKDAITGSTVHVSRRSRADRATHLCHLDWKFASGSEVHAAAMCFRWVLPDEFERLLRLAGFSSWEMTSGFGEKGSLTAGGEAVWAAFK